VVGLQCFIVNADNVGSKQLGDIRAALRNGMGNKDAEAVVYMGKNTLIRRTLNMMENKMFLNLIPEVRLNIGAMGAPGGIFNAL
jgi:ribosomal protein L10